MQGHTQDTHSPASLVATLGRPRPGWHLSPHHIFSLQKEERTMLEDIWVTLSELDNVTFSFKQLDETSVASESCVTRCPPWLSPAARLLTA